MDYTMDTLSIKNIQPSDGRCLTRESADGGSLSAHAQPFVHISQDHQGEQQYFNDTAVPCTSTVVGVVQAGARVSQGNSGASEMSDGYEMEPYISGVHPNHGKKGHDGPQFFENENKRLVKSAELEQQQPAEKECCCYGDNQTARQSMEVDQKQSSFQCAEADDVKQVRAMEVEDKPLKVETTANSSYNPIVSDFLPGTPHARETLYTDIPSDRENNIDNSQGQISLFAGSKQHIEKQQPNSQFIEESQEESTSYPKGYRDTDRTEHGLRISQEQNADFSVTPMDFESDLHENERNADPPLPLDRGNELSQSLEAANAVAALTSPTFEAAESSGSLESHTEAEHMDSDDPESQVLRKQNEELDSTRHSLSSDQPETEMVEADQKEGTLSLPGEAESGKEVAAGKMQTLNKSVEEEDEDTVIEAPLATGEQSNTVNGSGDKKTVKVQSISQQNKEVTAAAANGAAKRKLNKSKKPMAKSQRQATSDANNDPENFVQSLESLSPPPLSTSGKFKCKSCKKSFKLRKDLNKHMKTHITKASKKFPCTVCSSSFATKALLSKHLKAHDTKPYTCHDCLTTCRSLADLKDHRRIHSDVRAFSCTECSYSAKRQKDLSKHMLVHSTTKVHNCQFCKFSSKRKYSLQRHMKNYHSLAQMYECTICSLKTTAIDSFKVHVAMHASTGSTSCIICGAFIKKRPNLIEHLLSHSSDESTTCKECAETFTSSYEFMLHLLSHKDTSSSGPDDGKQGSVFDINSSSLINGSTDAASGTFNFLARKNKMVMDTPTMEGKISQMSSVASRLADMTKVVTLLNEKPKVFLQLGEISSLATELAVISGNVLQAYKNTYNISNTSPGSSKVKVPSTSSDVNEDSSFMSDEHNTSSAMNLSGDAIKEELQDNMYGSADAGMQIQVDINGEPVSCIQKEESYISAGEAKSKGEKQLKCNRCNLMFTDTRSLKRHMMAHDNVRPYACEKCGQSFRRNEHLKKHMVTHSDERPYVCKECPYAAKTEHRLKIHMLCHSQTKAFACQHCNYTARTNYELNHHMKKHDPRTCTQCSFVCYSRGEMKKHVFTHSSFDCSECDFSTNDRTEYTKHAKKHSLVQHLCCELCGYSCDTMKKFKYHKLRHENKTPFQCPDCDYKCSSRASYDCHRLKHAGLKPYLCSFCGAAFRKTSHLNQHLLIHKDEKAFKCSECGYSCRTKHNLKEHEMTHSGEKPFSCKYCSFSCRRNKALQLHMLKHESQGMMIPQMQMQSMQMPHMQMSLPMAMMPPGL